MENEIVPKAGWSKTFDLSSWFMWLCFFKHKLGKWSYHEGATQFYDLEFRQRTCKRCGHRKREIVSYCIKKPPEFLKN